MWLPSTIESFAPCWYSHWKFESGTRTVAHSKLWKPSSFWVRLTSMVKITDCQLVYVISNPIMISCLETYWLQKFLQYEKVSTLYALYLIVSIYIGSLYILRPLTCAVNVRILWRCPTEWWLGKSRWWVRCLRKDINLFKSVACAMWLKCCLLRTKHLNHRKSGKTYYYICFLLAPVQKNIELWKVKIHSDRKGIFDWPKLSHNPLRTKKPALNNVHT